MEELVSLPGVGRKTANVVMGAAFGLASGVVVDTHVARLSGRLGLSRERRPERIEEDLRDLLPASRWIQASHLLIRHGRQRCRARRPGCRGCELGRLCPSKEGDVRADAH